MGDCLKPPRPIILGLPTLIRTLPHPLRLGWQVPCVWILVGNQASLDLCLRAPRSAYWVEELGGVSRSPSPCMAASEPRGSARSVEHAHILRRMWAHDIPLPAPKVALTKGERERLLMTTKRKVQVTAARIEVNGHADDLARREGPDSPDVGSRFAGSIGDELCQIQHGTAF